jgi:hypothetical protein
MDLSVYIVYVGFVKRVTCLKGITNDESAIMCMMIGWNKYYYYYYYYYYYNNYIFCDCCGGKLHTILSKFCKTPEEIQKTWYTYFDFPFSVSRH